METTLHSRNMQKENYAQVRHEIQADSLQGISILQVPALKYWVDIKKVALCLDNVFDCLFSNHIK